MSTADGFWSVVSPGRSRTASGVEEWVAVDVMPRLAATEVNVTTLQTQFGTHTGNAIAHHAPYSDAEAIAAVGPHFSGDHANLINVNVDQHHVPADSGLDSLLAGVSRETDPNTGQDTLVFSGMNIQIVNGSGWTDITDGTGNLIIGYNELRTANNLRGGSHILVIGDRNNYTTNSYGGMVVGSDSEVSSMFASVSGGQYNRAAYDYASVSGGKHNKASGLNSSVSGGTGNEASGVYSSVSGGSDNLASHTWTSISGGEANLASGNHASVSGGHENIANFSWTSVSGGQLNIASQSGASVSGGIGNNASYYNSSVSGGRWNEASGSHSSVSGGENNLASGMGASVSGGISLTAPNNYCWKGSIFTDC